MAKLLTLTQAQAIANGVITKVANKNYAVSATTLAGYGIENAYTKDEVDAFIGATYRPAGTIAGSDLISSLLTAANVGNVYNISSDLAITAQNEDLFANLSRGDKVKTGDDVGVIVLPAAYTAASGKAQDGVTYYELEGGLYVVVSVTVGETDVDSYYTMDEPVYKFNDFAGFIDLSGVTYTAGDGLDLTNQEFSVDIDSTNANGLAVTASGVKLDAATPDTYAGQAATGTYVAGTVYYTSIDCTTEVDTTDFEAGVTLVSSYFVLVKSADGGNGAMTSADKYKLNSITVATDTEVAGVIAALDNL